MTGLYFGVVLHITFGLRMLLALFYIEKACKGQKGKTTKIHSLVRKFPKRTNMHKAFHIIARTTKMFLTE